MNPIIDKPNSLYSVGTRIISIHGEISDTDTAQDVFTGPNALGVISQVLNDQEHCYSVDFSLGVSVILSQEELADTSRYQVFRRVIAHFQPQAWINDTATNIDGACDIDVTDQLLEMSLKDILFLEDDDYPSDELVYGLTDHVGPHFVEVKDSVLEFFGVERLVDITEEMLFEKQRLHAMFSNSAIQNEDMIQTNKLSHSVVLINLTSGDSGLALNGKIVITADPQFESTSLVKQSAENLAAILGIELKTVDLDPPAKEDWNWGDVLLELPRYCHGKSVWTLREALEQTRAALPDSAFAAQDGIDPELILGINTALGSANFSDADLKSLLIDARAALPVAWQKYGGCSEELLNSIDLTIKN